MQFRLTKPGLYAAVTPFRSSGTPQRFSFQSLPSSTHPVSALAVVGLGRAFPHGSSLLPQPYLAPGRTVPIFPAAQAGIQYTNHYLTLSKPRVRRMIETIEPSHHQLHWYAVYIRSRHEKTGAEQLVFKSVDHFLPRYETVRKWKNGNFKVHLPLFPGYLFAHIPLHDRLQVRRCRAPCNWRVPGCPWRCLNPGSKPFRGALTKGLQAHPHPYLKVGSRVRVSSGPLESEADLAASTSGVSGSDYALNLD